MNISSLLLSIIFHAGIFLSTIIFFNSELRQKTKIRHDIISFDIIENNFFEKQKERKTLNNRQFKTYESKKAEPIKNLLKKN